MPDRIRILYLCTGNSRRSQMAEGWTPHPGGECVAVESAGIDLSGREPAVVSDAMLQCADVVVTVCGHADEQCPALPAGVHKIHWPLIDPAKATGIEEEVTAAFRATRGEVERRVRALLPALGVDATT